MTEWKSADIVTTTYGTIKKAQQESFDEGVAFERQRIIKMLEAEEKRLFLEEADAQSSFVVGLAIALIKGENK